MIGGVVIFKGCWLVDKYKFERKFLEIFFRGVLKYNFFNIEKKVFWMKIWKVYLLNLYMVRS